jgi:hypothetical protein
MTVKTGFQRFANHQTNPASGTFNPGMPEFFSPGVEWYDSVITPSKRLQKMQASANEIKSLTQGLLEGSARQPRCFRPFPMLPVELPLKICKLASPAQESWRPTSIELRLTWIEVIIMETFCDSATRHLLSCMFTGNLEALHLKNID